MSQKLSPNLILTRKKMRKTPFREKVLEIFLANDQAVSVSDIENHLGAHDRVTLYRTIKSFMEKGVIHEIVMPGDVRKLALCSMTCDGGEGHREHKHIHFQCKSCEEVFCIEVDELPEIELNNFMVEEVEVQMRGLCRACQ